MKFLLILASIANISIITSPPDQIMGKWYTVEQRSTINVQKKSDEYYFGEVISINKNVNNPNSENLLGKEILRNLKYSNSKDLYEGQIYLPRYNKYTGCTIKLTDDKLQITIETKFLNKTVEWTRKK